MTTTSTDPTLAASPESAFQFLQVQIAYGTSHLQIADAKAAGIIAYITVLSGYTASKDSISTEQSLKLAGWLALSGGVVGLVALAAGFFAVMPRRWPGRFPHDPFSWVGLSAAAAGVPYHERLPELTLSEMNQALADTVETCACIIHRKYRLITVAVLASIGATALQSVSWLFA